ncbi:MAG: outer membrane protein assembly factor BamA [Deferribacteres bacterium]|nr:outer membrane protein assembly factor BamA [candidate division KSB1 bacterium]MCB9504423.1 outer membrane protein assembly factor BamA [Deferribacteres bacterium]
MLRFLPKFPFVFLLLLLPVIAFSQGNRKAEVLSFVIEGNKTTDEGLIKFTAGFTEGSKIGGDDIQNAIRQLWDLGMFSDIQFYLDKEIGNGLYLRLKLQEFPHLEKIQLQGNKKIKTKDIKKDVDFYPGQMLGPAKINQMRRKILDLYKEKGYLLADVETKSTPSEERPNYIVVRFDINEGNKVQVQKIRFHGNSTFENKKLRKQFKETKEDTWWRGADFDPEEFAEDKGLVLDFYRKEGFRDAEILRDSLSYGPEQKDMFIDIWVREGIRYKFGKINFDGNKLYTTEQLYATADIKEGDIYNAEKLQEVVSEKLGTLYYDAGYIYARIIPQETPVAKDTVNLTFLINEEKPVKVRKIKIVGNSTTKDKVIRRELHMFPGQTFSKALLMRSQREVWVLNYFANVNPTIETVDDENIDISIEVEERGTSTANMSAGWSERDKIIGSIGVNMNNFAGGGQQVGFDWNFGRYYRSFQINFTEPWLMDTPTLAGFSIYDTERSPTYAGYRQESRGASLRLGRRFQWPDNYFRGDWIYRIDRTNLSDFQSWFASSVNTAYFEDVYPQTSSSITQIISRNSLNRVEFPTEGSAFSVSTEVSGGVLGGTVEFHKHQFKAEWFTPLMWTLVMHSDFTSGIIKEFGKSGFIPYLEKFFMGGEGLTRSIPLRGYDDPLGNSSNTVDRNGGTAMMKYSLELRVPISPNPTIYALTFAEAGRTWEKLREFNPSNMRRSVGFGARVFMPMIGMLGFDYAYGFDNIDPITGKSYGGWKPHFVFGQQF